jgi:hypothetical protein
MSRGLLSIVIWLTGGFVVGTAAHVLDWGEVTFGIASLVLAVALSAVTIGLLTRSGEH